MFGVSAGTAALIGGGLAAGGAIYGANKASSAAKNAANLQSQAAQNATQLQQQEYDQTRADNMPALDARNAALAQLQGEWGPNGSFTKALDPSALSSDPAYQWAQQQGELGLNRQAAAAGRLYSGAQLKAASQFNTGNATQYLNDAFNRQQAVRGSQTNAQQSIAGLGQSAANTISGSGANYANNAGQNLMGAANAQGAAGIAGANAWGNAMNSAAGWGMAQKWGQPSTAPRDPWAGSGAGGSWGSSYGTSGLDNFFYGSGTSGD